MFDGELINSEHPINADFIQRRKDKGKWNDGAPFKDKKPPIDLPAADIADSPKNFGDPPPYSDVSDLDIGTEGIRDKSKNGYLLDLQIKELKIERDIEEVQIARMKKEKMQGETIPTEIVQSLMTQHFKNMTRAIIDGVLSYSGIMVKRLGGTKAEKTELQTTFEAIVNESIHKAKELTSAELASIVDQYKIKRLPGERK